jgi:hypothetical protein
VNDEDRQAFGWLRANVGAERMEAVSRRKQETICFRTVPVPRGVAADPTSGGAPAVTHTDVGGRHLVQYVNCLAGATRVRFVLLDSLAYPDLVTDPGNSGGVCQ